MVLAVLLLIAALVGPLTVRMMVRLRVEGFADQLSMLIQRTRSQAVRENQTYSIDWGVANDTIVPSGPGISDAAILLAAEAHGLTRYTDPPCLDPDGDGVNEAIDPPLSFDGLGSPSGLVAFCFNDPPRASSGRSNVMQVRIDSVAGVVTVGKLIYDTTVTTGVRFADEDTEKFTWEWY